MWDWFKAEKHVNQNVQIFEEPFVLGSPSKKVKTYVFDWVNITGFNKHQFSYFSTIEDLN